MSNDPIGDSLEITTSDGCNEVTPVRSAMSKSLKIQEKKKQT